MDSINKERISGIEDRGNIVSFSDGINEYSFNIAKSTLYKRFHTKDILLDLPVKILDDPFEALEKMFRAAESAASSALIREQLHVFLPLITLELHLGLMTKHCTAQLYSKLRQFEPCRFGHNPLRHKEKAVPLSRRTALFEDWSGRLALV